MSLLSSTHGQKKTAATKTRNHNKPLLIQKTSTTKGLTEELGNAAGMEFVQQEESLEFDASTTKEKPTKDKTYREGFFIYKRNQIQTKITF